jgi:hypothetical protein
MKSIIKWWHMVGNAKKEIIMDAAGSTLATLTKQWFAQIPFKGGRLDRALSEAPGFIQNDVKQERAVKVLAEANRAFEMGGMPRGYATDGTPEGELRVWQLTQKDTRDRNELLHQRLFP